jgi:glucokinase
MRYVVAIDVGGTFIKSALVSEDLKILEKQTHPTPNNDPLGELVAGEIANIFNLYKQTHPELNITALGLVTPGACDEKNGEVIWAGNLNWRNVPIKKMVAALVSVPVAFGHDVRTAMVAEQRLGKAHDCQDAILIPIGTGIAAAIVQAGIIYSNRGFFGEVGHLKVNHQRKCVCGQIGCLEAISSASAICANYLDLTGKSLSAEAIVELAKNQDLPAQKVWRAAIDGLAIAIEVLITLFAPEKIILAGGVSNAGEFLLSPIKEKVTSALTFQIKPELSIAKFGSDAGVIGTALIALDTLK